MTPEVRPYQVEAEEQIAARMRAGCRSLVYVLPTGGGKTVVASRLAQRAVARGKSVMFLVHRRELVRQAFETMTFALPGVSIGVEAAGWPALPWARVRVGSVQSLRRRIANIPPPDVVFVDEAHHARARTWEMVLGAWPNAYLVGLTATPERLDGLGLGEWFAEIVMGPSVGELVANRYLAPTEVYRIRPTEVDAHKRGAWTDAAEAYCRYTPGRQALFFGRSVAHSQAVVAELQDRRVSAEHLDGSDTDARRDWLVRAFSDGAITVLGNCELFDEGFDVPGCEVVIVGRYTKSVTRWLQMCGRGMRPGPGKRCTILDTAGVSHDLGSPTETRTWSLEDGEIETRKNGKPAAKAKRDIGGAAEQVDLVERELVVMGSGADAAQAWRDEMPETAPKKPPSKRATARRAIESIKGKSSDSRDYLARLEALAASLGHKPGWARHMARIHRL